jgi:hypothetical protein
VTRRSSTAIGLIILSILSVPCFLSAADNNAPRQAAPSASVVPLFTPEDDCIRAIVESLDAAQKTVRMQAYFITSDRIGIALIAAKARGLDVQVILDAGLADCAGTEAQKLADNNVTVLVDAAHTRAHNKVIVIDGFTVITGGVEFSRKQQPLNADSMLIISGMPEIARRYTLNWTNHAKHAVPLSQLAKIFRNRPAIDPDADGAQPAARPDGQAAGVAAAANPDPNAQPNQGLVYVTPSGKRYHRQDCRHIRTGADAITVPQAIAAGKTPCKVCKP